MAPWTCFACTLENEGGTRCEICGTPNPSVGTKCQKCEELNKGRENAWDFTLCRDCRGKPAEEEDAVPEPIPTISKYGLCMLCYSRVRLKRAVTIPECNDTFCRPCFKKWVEARVVPIPFANVATHGDVFRLACPLDSCGTKLSWRDAEAAVGIQAMRRFGEWQAEALTHLYTAASDALPEAGAAGVGVNSEPRSEKTFCSNAACRLRTGARTCVAERDLHLWSMQEIAKALNVHGLPCPDNRDEAAQRLASFLHVTLKPTPSIDLNPPQVINPPPVPSPRASKAKEPKNKAPEKAGEAALGPPADLPSMTSAERHVWHFCTSCAARVCNACGWRDDRRSKRDAASTSSSDSQEACSQWQSWAVFHALKRLDYEWDKYPEALAHWPRHKSDKGDVGVGSVEKTVAKREAERSAGAVWAKGTGYGGDDDRSAYYGGMHRSHHTGVNLKPGQLLERSTGDAAIEPVVTLLVDALGLSATRDRFGTPVEAPPSIDGPFTEPAPIPLGACSLLRQSRPFRRFLRFGLQAHPLGFWNTGTGVSADFGKGRAKLARLYLTLLRYLAGDAGLRGLLFSDLFSSKAHGSSTAGSRLIAALVELHSEVAKPGGRSVGNAIRSVFGRGSGGSSSGAAGPSDTDAGKSDEELGDVIRGVYSHLWGSEEWTDSEGAWKRKATKSDDSNDEEDDVTEGAGANAEVSARKDAEKEAYKAALRPLQFMEASISENHYFTKGQSAASSSGCGGHLHQHQKHVMKEMQNLAESLPLEWDSSIHIRVDSSQTHVLKALILAPNETPYANGAFVFDIQLPPNYPAVAPKFQLLTTGGGTVRFNPNLYECGKVCLSLLGTWSGPGWKPFESTLLQVLVSIQSFIFVAEPYYNEPGHELHMQAAMSQQYNADIRRHCLQQAIHNQLRKPPAAFADVTLEHFSRKRREIEEQCATWIMESDTLAGGDITRVTEELKAEFKSRFGPLPEPGREPRGEREVSEERAVKRANIGK